VDVPSGGPGDDSTVSSALNRGVRIRVTRAPIASPPRWLAKQARANRDATEVQVTIQRPVAGAAFHETDTVTVSDDRAGHAAAAIVGGGMKYHVSPRWGLQIDARVVLSIPASSPACSGDSDETGSRDPGGTAEHPAVRVVPKPPGLCQNLLFRRRNTFNRARVFARTLAPVPATTEEAGMPIVAVFQSPSLTQEKYEESVRRLTGGRSRLASPADWPVEGLLVHVAGQGERGFRVVDVWTSEEAFRQFGEKLMPVLKAVGVDGQAEIYQAHTFVAA
jgi:hypothetical protein